MILMHATPPKPEQRTADDPEEVCARSAATPVNVDFLAPAQRSDELGRLGHYRILKVLGKGGMGLVFLAEDTKLDRLVALKVMLPKFAEDQAAKHRFLREAKSAAAIEHDHIVHIYQVDEDRGVPFLAMQLLSGSSLEDVLKRAGRLTTPQILRLGAQIAEGLAVAHAKGLIHRDIKPANIWVEANYGGRVKLLDFGLARMVQTDVGITQSGAIVGTPAYMAPEQARGDKVDQRCDLYALGCVLYRMATCDLPIKGKDTMALLMALALNEPKPPKLINEAIFDGLNELILQLLAKDASKRPESAKVVAATLRKMEREVARANEPADVTDELVAMAQPVVPVPASSTAPARPARPQAGCDPATPTLPDHGQTHPIAAAPTRIALPRGRRRFAWAAGAAAVIMVAALVIRQFRDSDQGTFVNDGIREQITPRASSWALQFDGKSSYVSVPTLKYDGTHALTIELDLKPTTLHVADIFTDGQTGLVWDAKRGPTHFAFGVAAEKDWVAARARIDSLPSKVVHLAGVFDLSEVRIYLNGKLAERSPFGANKVKRSSDVFTIGSNPWLAARTKPAQKSDNESFLNYFEGLIQRVRVSKVPRYDKDFTPDGRFHPDKDTIALYHFDEGQGAKLTDSSGNNHHGKIDGAKWVKVGLEGAAPKLIPQTAPYTSPSQHALAFDGRSSHVLVPTWKYNGTHPLTIEMDIKPAKLQAADILSDGVFEFGWRKSRLEFGVGTDDFGWFGVNAKVGELPKQAQHVAIVLNRDEMRIYLNGNMAGKTSLDGKKVRPTQEVLTLGAHAWTARTKPKAKDETKGFLNYFEGQIQRIRISKVARYDEDFAPPGRYDPDKETMALYHFDEGQGDKLIDSSGNRHHGKIIGAKWVRVDGAPDVSLQFDGKTNYVEVPSLRFDSEQPITVEGLVTIDQEQDAMLLCRVAGKSWMSLSASGKQWGLVGVRNQQQQGVAAPNTLVRGVKAHVAGTWDGKQLRLFINGKESTDRVKLASKPITIKSGQTGTTQIGGAPGSTVFLAGKIHGLRVAKIARYDKDFTPPSHFASDEDTIALFRFNEGQGNKLIDSSDNGHDGKIFGAKWVRVDREAQPAQESRQKHNPER